MYQRVYLGFFKKRKRLLGQAVKTSPFHGGNTGSIPVGVIRFEPEKAGLVVRNNREKLVSKNMPMWLNWQSS